MQDSSEIAKINRNRYLKAPSINVIQEFLDFLQAKDSELERFLGIKRGTISCIRIGERKMPTRCWHWVYEKKLPSQSKSIIKNKSFSIAAPKKNPKVKQTYGNNKTLGILNNLKKEND